MHRLSPNPLPGIPQVNWNWSAGLRLVCIFLVGWPALRCTGAEPVQSPPLVGVDLRLPFRAERNLAYSKLAGGKLLADLVAPDDDVARPAVILIHGGAWVAGDKEQMDWIARRLARSGFVTLNINYRLAPTHTFPAQIEDCRAAQQWLLANAERYHVRTDWVAAYGYSAGAQLALLMGLEQAGGKPNDQPAPAQQQATEKPKAQTADAGKAAFPVDKTEADEGPAVRAVVAGGAPCDFTQLPPNFVGLTYFFGGTRAQVPDRYRAASPLSFCSQDDPPVFFYHGTQDFLVPMRGSQLAFQRLQGLGVNTTFHEVANQGHVGAYLDGQAVQAAIKFLVESYEQSLR